MVQPGCLHIAVGGCNSYDLYKKSDKIVTDSWHHVKHRGTGVLAKAGNENLISDDDIYAQKLGEIINNKKPGRESQSEIIYFSPVGLGVEDVALATRIYRKALSEGAGTLLKYW